MKNQQFAGYRAGQYDSQLPPGYMAAATQPGRSLAAGIQGGLQALAAGVMRRNSNQREDAQRARDEAKEEEKAAKARADEFDRLDKQGQYMELWGPDGKSQMNSQQMAGMLAGRIAQSQLEERQSNIDVRQLGAQLQEEKFQAYLDQQAKQNDFTGQGLALQQRASQLAGAKHEQDLANQQGRSQGIAAALSLSNPEYGEQAAMYPAAAADIAKLMPTAADGWNLQPGQTVKFEDGSTGLSTSRNSVQIQGPNGPDEVSMQELEDGTKVLYKNGQAWKTVNPDRLSPMEQALVGMLGGGAAPARGSGRSTGRAENDPLGLR